MRAGGGVWANARSDRLAFEGEGRPALTIGVGEKETIAPVEGSVVKEGRRGRASARVERSSYQGGRPERERRRE